MNTKNILKQLQIDEGVKYTIYRDHLGFLTFGVGHFISEKDPEYGLEEGTSVSVARVTEALLEDLENATWDCEMIFGTSRFRGFPDEVQEVVVNMMFNLGRTRFAKFVNFRAALEEHNWNKAAKEGRDSLWYHQVKNRAERLMSRLENIA